MKRKAKNSLALPAAFAFLLLALVFVIASFVFPQSTRFQSILTSMQSMAASVFFTDSTSEQHLLDRYNSAKKGSAPVKILIVAGHDNEKPGAEYRKRREAEMTAQLADRLAQFLQADPEFQAVLTRTSLGYNSLFWDYRERNLNTISDFIRSKKLDMQRLLADGSLHEHDGVKHNTAPDRVIATLYSINRWANESAVDLVIHIHFNDAAERVTENPYKYSGFSIYIPEKQYSNARASRAVAKPIFDRLSHFYSVSDLPKEDAGIVESQDLIAVGAYNTLDPAGMLIEYGYIYEPQFENEQVRDKTIDELAWQTYLGIQDFFNTKKSNKLALTDSLDGSTFDVQKALLLLDAYPPKGKTLRECPLSGNFGGCTSSALSFFQAREKIVGENGKVGQGTLDALQSRLSVLGL